jgi:hypothetical protein
MVIREAYANYQGAWLGANGGTNLLMFWTFCPFFPCCFLFWSVNLK